MAQDVTFWLAVYASADHTEIGCGARPFWTEEEAYAALRSDLYDHFMENDTEGMFPDAAAEAAANAFVDGIADADLGDALADRFGGDDYLWTVTVEKHTLPAPPDLTTPDKIEEFLG